MVCSWAWSTLLAASVPYVLGVLAYFLHRAFWACFRSLVALSGTWVPAGFSGVEEKTLLRLCWLPLFGACSRRCGSCRPPALAFLAASALARLRLFLSAPPWRLLVVISYVMHAVRRLLYMCFLVPVLLHTAGFRRPILPWLSFSGRRCSGPVPVLRLLPVSYRLCFSFAVGFRASALPAMASAVAFALTCTATSICSRCFCQFAADHSPLFSAPLPPGWPPLLGACRLLFFVSPSYTAALCVQARMVVLHLPCASDPAAPPGHASLFVRVRRFACLLPLSVRLCPCLCPCLCLCPSLSLSWPGPAGTSIFRLGGFVLSLFFWCNLAALVYSSAGTLRGGGL